MGEGGGGAGGGGSMVPGGGGFWVPGQGGRVLSWCSDFILQAMRRGPDLEEAKLALRVLLQTPVSMQGFRGATPRRFTVLRRTPWDCDRMWLFPVFAGPVQRSQKALFAELTMQDHFYEHGGQVGYEPFAQCGANVAMQRTGRAWPSRFWCFALDLLWR